jgi:hypothetical protein
MQHFLDSAFCLAQMLTTQVEPVQDRMTSEATCGIWIAAVPKAHSMARVGQYSTHFLDGPIMQRVRIVICRSSAEMLTNFHLPRIVGSVLAYVFYWLAVVAVLVFMKFNEVSFAPGSSLRLPCLTSSSAQGRTKFLGRESAAGVRRRETQAARAATNEMTDSKTELPK